MPDLTLEDLMQRAMAGESVDASSYTDALKALAGGGAAQPDPTQDATLQKMYEDKGSLAAGAVADSMGPSPIGRRAQSDALLTRMLRGGSSPAARALAETMSDRVVPATTEQGLLEPGNLDLTARPYAKNPDGSTSTVRSMGIGFDGKEYLIPTVSHDGRVMSGQEAADYFKETGEHMGVYASPEASTRAGETIHLDQMAHPPRNTLASPGAPDPLATFAKTSTQGVAPQDAAKTEPSKLPASTATVPEAIAGVQSDLTPDSLTKLATGQPAEGSVVTSGGFTERSPAEEEQRNQEARRSAGAKEYREFISKRQGPGEEPIVGPLEKAFLAKQGEEYGGNKWLAALTNEGSALYEKRKDRWEEQRGAARAADHEKWAANKPISNAMVGLISRTNPSIPLDEIAKMTESDPLVKLMGQGGLGQDEKLRLELIRLKGKEIGTDSSERRDALNNAVKLKLEQIRASAVASKGKGKGGGGGRGLEMRASVLAQQLTDQGLPTLTDQAMALLNGTADLSQYDEKALGVIDRSTGLIKNMSPDAFEGYEKTTTGRAPQFTGSVTAATQRKSDDPIIHDKVRTAMNPMLHSLKFAKQAWREMTPAAKEALATFDGKSDLGGFITKLLTTEKDTANINRLQRLLTAYKKVQTGLASTDAEARGAAGGAGFARNNYDWLNSPRSFQQFLDDADQEMRARYESAAKSFPGIWDK